MARFGITEKAAFHSHETAVADKVLKSDNSTGGGFCVFPFEEDVKRVPSTKYIRHRNIAQILYFKLLSFPPTSAAGSYTRSRVVPSYRFWWEGSPTKIDYQKRVPLF